MCPKIDIFYIFAVALVVLLPYSNNDASFTIKVGTYTNVSIVSDNIEFII